MFAKVQTIMQIIENLAPKKYALEMDNVGFKSEILIMKLIRY